MNKKHAILIIVILIAVGAVIGAYMMFNDAPVETTTASTTTSFENRTMILSKSAYMKVPINPNATDKVNKKGMHYYKDNESDINITSCSNLSASSSAKEMKKLKNSIATGAKKSKEHNVVVYEKDGVYSIFVRNIQYNDTLLIQSSDKDLLFLCWETLNYHDPAHKVHFDDEKDSKDSSSGSGAIDVAQKTESAVKSSSSSTKSTSSSSSSSSHANSWDYYNWGSGSSSQKSKPSTYDRFNVDDL
jgi:hypothetical protein